MKKKPAKKTVKRKAVKNVVKKPKKKTVLKKKSSPQRVKASRENGKLGGAPSKEDIINIDKMCRLMELGSTDEQISIALGITTKTLVKYKKHGRFLRAVEESEKLATGKVKKSLFRRACGYEYEEVIREPRQIIEYEDGKRVSMRLDENDMIVTKRIRKKMHPEVNAINLWLNNRLEDWKPSTNAPPVVNNTNINKVETNNNVKPEEFGESEVRRYERNLRLLQKDRGLTPVES